MEFVRLLVTLQGARKVDRENGRVIRGDFGVLINISKKVDE